MECIKRFVHELYLIILYKIKKKNHKGKFFFLKYKMVQQIIAILNSTSQFLDVYIYIEYRCGFGRFI